MSTRKPKTGFDKRDRLLAHMRRRDTIDVSIAHAVESRRHVLTAIEALSDLDHMTAAVPRQTLRGALPEIDRAITRLRRVRGNCARAIANVARSKDA